MYESGDLIPAMYNSKHTQETKDKISKSRIEYLESHNNYGLTWFEVSNGNKIIKVQGTWELKVAEWLNECGIKWDRLSIKYRKNRRYTPDFYLPDYNIYIEVKGWMKDRDVYKMYSVLDENDIDIRLIESKEIKMLNELNIKSLPKFVNEYKKDDINFDKFDIRY